MSSSEMGVPLSQLLSLQTELKHLCLSKKRLKTNVGQYHGLSRGRGVDFSEARAYQSGDEIRHMHWAVSARTQSPHVKVYHQEKERPLYIITDLNASMYFGSVKALKSQWAVKLTATLLLAALRMGDRAGGALCHGQKVITVKPKLRQQALMPYFQALSDASYHRPDTESLLSNTLQGANRLIAPGGAIVIISDFYHLDALFMQTLQRLNKYHDVSAVVMRDKLECNILNPGMYSISNGQQQMKLDMRNSKVQAIYQATIDEHKEKIAEGLCGIPVLYQDGFETSAELAQALLMQLGMWSRR